MNLSIRTLPLAALLGLALLAGCEPSPKSPKVTEDHRPAGVDRERATGSITGSAGTATGAGGAGATAQPGTPSGTLPEASGPAVTAGSEPTAGGSSGSPVGAGDGRSVGGTTPPSTAVPASRTASMAAGAQDLANRAPGLGGTQAAPGGDAPFKAASQAPRLSSAERSFVQTAAGLGLYEIAAGQLGQARAQDPAVRAWAERMQQDHAKAQEQLQQLANRHELKLPTQMPADRLAVVERLQHSESFDAAFVNTVGVQDHRSTIDRFEKASHEAKDPDLKAWIAQTLPALREHLAQARKLPGADKR